MKKPEPKPLEAPQRSLLTVVACAWRDLLSTRTSILRRLYADNLKSCGAPPPADMPLDKLRKLVMESLHGDADGCQTSITQREKMIVRGARLIAGWIAFWTSPAVLLLPVAYVWWGVEQIASGQGDIARFLVMGLIMIPIFFGILFIGIFAQMFFLHPFDAFIRWACGTKALMEDVATTSSMLAPSASHQSHRDLPSKRD